MNPVLVLASASPRRQELLQNAGIRFRVQPSDLPETRLAGELPLDFARRMAQLKARFVLGKLDGNAELNNVGGEGLYVLGADTIVVAGDEVLGKPVDAQDAERMLQMLSGRMHEVVTAVCLTGREPQGKFFEDIRSETTQVAFDEIRLEEIRQYVAQGEPMDKAGAYAIQGMASRWTRSLRGDYSNVVGLPVRLVYRMLCEHGAIATG